MKFEYKMDRSDLKKIMLKNYSKLNIIYLIIGIIFFIIITYKIATYNALIFLTSLIIYTLIMIGILFGISLIFVTIMLKYNDRFTDNAYGLYQISINKNKIEEKINDQKFVMNISDIKKVKIKDNTITILDGSKLAFIFNKDLFVKSKDYDKLVDYLAKLNLTPNN